MYCTDATITHRHTLLQIVGRHYGDTVAVSSLEKKIHQAFTPFHFWRYSQQWIFLLALFLPALLFVRQELTRFLEISDASVFFLCYRLVLSSNLALTRRQIESQPTPRKTPSRPPILTQAQIEELAEFIYTTTAKRRMSFSKITEGLYFRKLKRMLFGQHY